MSIPEACIEAASVDAVDVALVDRHEATARRVILALAENLPESAVEKALRRYYNIGEKDSLKVATCAKSHGGKFSASRARAKPS